MTSQRRRLFVPILAGATPRDRAVACVGALLGIVLVGLAGALVHGDGAQTPWIIAPMGATAVLLFAVPASPMSQPWPIVGGNCLSAAVGFAVVQVIDDRTVAVGVAVGLAIGLMSLTRSLHPPGGATALTAALAGPAVASAGDLFPLVALNTVGLVALGWAFHRFSGHSYPHVSPSARPEEGPTTDLPASQRVGFRAEDVDAVLAKLGDAYDIGRDDLGLLLREVESQALVREHGDLTCAEVMSRDVITVDRDADPAVARRLLLESGVRLLPVLDAEGRVLGGVGLRELTLNAGTLEHAMAHALTTTPERPVIELMRPLTDGRHHGAMIVDQDRRLMGLVTQTDLLAAVARQLDRAPLST